jgi:arylsulfatase A-like enzyme
MAGRSIVRNSNSVLMAGLLGCLACGCGTEYPTAATIRANLHAAGDKQHDPKQYAVGEYVHWARDELRYVSLRPDGTAKVGIEGGFGGTSFFAKWDVSADRLSLSHPAVHVELDGERVGDGDTFAFSGPDFTDPDGRVYQKNMTVPQFDRLGQLELALAASARGVIASSEQATQPTAAPAGDAETTTSADSNRLNLILISIDTLRADHLGCYGYDRPTSPVLDRLAADSIVFENVSSAAPWTLPAHASLFTGLYAQRHGVVSFTDFMPPVPTLAAILQAQGYYTVGIANTFLISREYGLDHGFEEFVLISGEQTHNPMPSGVMDRATRWLKWRELQPFFMFLHFYDVHTDYRSLPQYEKLFVEKYVGPVDGTGTQLVAHLHDEISLDAEDAEHLVNLYDAQIRQMDDQMAWLLQVLEQRELLDNTVIMITSDHGEQFLEHGKFLHGQYQWEEALHVPLIVHGPGLPRGKRVPELASLVDVMPTALKILGVECPAGVDGVDLSPAWQESKPDWSSRIIFAGGDSGHWGPLEGRDDVKKVARDARFKLHYNTVTGATELYDLQSDPGETADVSDREPAVFTRLRERLDEHLQGAAAGGKRTNSLSDEQLQQLKSLGYLN